VPPVAVFDTNVLFSALGWKGNPFRCLELARVGVVEGVTCRELLDELTEKLESKLSFSAEQGLQTVADLLTFLRVVSITGQLKAVPADPDDDKVLECAIAAGATHVVTGDRRHLLALGSFQGILIVSAADFLAAATRSQTDDPRT
jgi:putative PIN family toxin of toxin-antitoxin system